MAEPKRYSLTGEVLAEFLGTLVLIALGDGVVAMVVLLDKGGYANITLGWGLAVTLGACVAGRVSGAHLNPALTLALAAFREHDPDLSRTAGVFTTFPLFPDAWAFGLIDQVVGTALLLGLLLAITD